MIEFFQQKMKSHFPVESCYNTRFVVQVLADEKKLIPLDKATPPKIGFMRKCKDYDKRKFHDIIKNDAEMRKYIPDETPPSRFERDTLLAVS